MSFISIIINEKRLKEIGRNTQTTKYAGYKYFRRIKTET